MRTFLSVILVVSLFVSFGTALPAAAADQVTPSNIPYKDIGLHIDNYVAEREAGLASCAVSVFDRNGMIFNNYYGYSDIENGVPADEETVYEWGSCTKLLVWVSVMQQWELGRIDLHTDIREYLPDGFLTKLQYEDEKITMLNLMNHNAGFQESFYENQQAAPDEVYNTLEEAVKACECYQAYHVGEYTAYSNWGTALAAHIVERTSGEDFVTYVNRYIFDPLGMKHTSIDPKLKDNEWVAEKRRELKCYARYDDPKDNEDYGVCMYGVQLYPAGSAMGTLADFSTFGQAFIAENGPLFQNNETRELLFSATSFYGDSYIAKNCHGLWTSEYKVQTLGHTGNTAGCSSNLVFDPVSGLGVVIMTNENGETAFNFGIPSLLFGRITDREEVKNAVITDDADISGTYLSKRSIAKGAGKAMSYMGGLFPWSAYGDGSYAMKLFGIPIGDAELTQIANHMYVMYSNGMEIFLYGSKTPDGRKKLEMMSADYLEDPNAGIGMLAAFGFILLGLGCIITLIVKLLALGIRKVRKTTRKHTPADRCIIAQQCVFAISGVLFAKLTLVTGAVTPVFTVFSGIIAMLGGLLSLANIGFLCCNTIRMEEVRTRTKARQCIWMVLCAAYIVFVIVFQLYNFWNL